MHSTIETTSPVYFEASVADFQAQAKQSGWAFWRGVLVGFVASFPLAHVAMGEQLLGLSL